MFSGAARVVRDWWNVRDRGLPTGIWNCASSLGPTIAPPLLTVLMISFGWRWMFVSMGLLGIVVAIVWYTVYREVAEATLSSGEAHHLTEGEEEPPPAQHVTLAEWRQLFGFSVTWGLILGFFGIVYMVWLFQAWLPGYLEIQRHMSIRTTGFVAAIPYACGVVGSVGAGWVTDRLMAGGFSPINSRKLPISSAWWRWRYSPSSQPKRRATWWRLWPSRPQSSSPVAQVACRGPWLPSPHRPTARRLWVPSRISAGMLEARWLPP
jgi:sugar phosphate permease